MINGFNGCCFAYGQTGSGENAGNSKCLCSCTRAKMNIATAPQFMCNYCVSSTSCTTGKTYSMFGEGAGNSRGMIPRCMEEVFAQLDRKAKVQSVYSAREELFKNFAEVWLVRLLP